MLSFYLFTVFLLHVLPFAVTEGCCPKMAPPVISGAKKMCTDWKLESYAGLCHVMCVSHSIFCYIAQHHATHSVERKYTFKLQETGAEQCCDHIRTHTEQVTVKLKVISAVKSLFLQVLCFRGATSNVIPFKHFSFHTSRVFFVCVLTENALMKYTHFFFLYLKDLSSSFRWREIS